MSTISADPTAAAGSYAQSEGCIAAASAG